MCGGPLPTHWRDEMGEPTPMELAAKPAHIVIEDDGSYSVEVRISPTEHLTVEVKGDTIEAAVTRDGKIVMLKSAAHRGVAVVDVLRAQAELSRLNTMLSSDDVDLQAAWEKVLTVKGILNVAVGAAIATEVGA